MSVNNKKPAGKKIAGKGKTKQTPVTDPAIIQLYTIFNQVNQRLANIELQLKGANINIDLLKKTIELNEKELAFLQKQIKLDEKLEKLVSE